MVAALLFALTAPAFGHDLFLKPDNFFLLPNSRLSISILNGTFQSSEAPVAFARLTDVSVVSPSGSRSRPDESDFRKNETTSFLDLVPPEAGNYVVGLSTGWRENALAAKEFNEYLVLEGIPDVLEARKRDKELDRDARYRYSKYVKTIVQVGSKRTDSFRTVLGYPVEMVPQTNPYALRRGATIEILCLKDGKPLVGQTVLVGYEAGGKVSAEKAFRSDRKGIIKVRLGSAGKWYAKFINMVKVNDPKLNYESKWATLTFEIK